MANLNSSSLPNILNNQAELKQMMKDFIPILLSQHQMQQDQLQNNIREELTDLKRLILNLEKQSNNETSNNQQADDGGQNKEEPFQKIFQKYFTSEILSTYYGDITSHICALIR